MKAFLKDSTRLKLFHLCLMIRGPELKYHILSGPEHKKGKRMNRIQQITVKCLCFVIHPLWIFSISEVWKIYTVSSVSLFIYSSWHTWLRRSSVPQDYNNVLLYFLLLDIQCVLVILNTLFLFRADFKSSQQNGEKDTELSHMPPASIHALHPWLSTSLFQMVLFFKIKDELTWHPMSIVYINVHFSCSLFWVWTNV